MLDLAHTTQAYSYIRFNKWALSVWKVVNNYIRNCQINVEWVQRNSLVTVNLYYLNAFDDLNGPTLHLLYAFDHTTDSDTQLLKVLFTSKPKF